MDAFNEGLAVLLGFPGQRHLLAIERHVKKIRSRPDEAIFTVVRQLRCGLQGKFAHHIPGDHGACGTSVDQRPIWLHTPKNGVSGLLVLPMPCRIYDRHSSERSPTVMGSVNVRHTRSAQVLRLPL